MAKKITETGPKPLRGIRNPDLYITKNNPVDASFSDIELQSLKDRANRARIRNYNTQHGHIGYDELRDTSVITPQYSNLDYGKSSYDKGVLVNPDATDVQNIRADRQPWYAKIASGLGKAITTAGTTLIDNTLGLVVGAAQGIANLTDDNPDTGFINGIVDNPVTRAMKSFSDYMEEIMPNYYSEDEQEHPFRHLLSANFIGDKMIKNLGFVVGSIYSGGGWGSLTRGGLTALGKAALKGASKFTNPTWISASNKLAKGIFKSTPTISSAVATFTGAVGESSLEALSAQQEFEEQNLQVLQQDYETKIAQLDYLLQTGQISQAEYNNQGERLRDAKINTEARIKKDALGVANVTFGMNMPVIWAADAMWLGKMFAKGFSSTSKAVVPKPKAIIGNLKEGYSTKFSNVKDAFNVAKGPLGEGAQEFLQRVSADTAKDMYGNDVTEYYAAALDGKAHKENLNFIGSLGKAMTENLGSESAWEEFLIGSLTSLIGAPKVGVKTKADGSKGLSFEMAGNIFSEIKGINEDRNATREAVEAINNRLSDPKFSEYWNALVRHNSLEKVMSEAASTGDKFTFKNAEATQTNSDIELFRKIGRLNDLKTFINESTDIDEAGAEQLISMFDKQVESEDNKTTIANLENGLKDAEELLIALRKEEEAIKKELEDESDNLWANRDNLDVVDAYEKLEETLKENRNRQDEVSKEIQRFNNRLAFGKNSKTTNPYTDEHGNRLSLEEIQKKLQTNAKELVNHIESYETEAELINSLTHNALSAEGVAFLTNMSMLNKDAAERIHSIFKNELAELNSVRDEINDTVMPLLDKEDSSIEDPVRTRKGLEAILELISGVDNPKNRGRIIHSLRTNPELLKSIKEIVRESDAIFPDSRVKMLEALDDAIKLIDRVDEISQSLKWFLQSNERVEQHLSEDLKTALQARKQAELNEATDKLSNAQTKEEIDEILDNLNYRDSEEALDKAKERNPKIQDREDLIRKRDNLLRKIEDNDELDEQEKVAAASAVIDAFNASQTSDEFVELMDNEDTIRSITNMENYNSIEAYEDSLANIRGALRSSLESIEEDARVSTNLAPAVQTESEPSDEPSSGKDGPVRNAGGKPSPSPAPIVNPTIVNTIDANDKIIYPPEVVDKNLYIRTTRHIWRGQTTPSTFHKMVDAQNYSEAYKNKIKTVHDYLVDNGAFSYIEDGNLSTKDLIYYVVDPNLVIEGHPIVLMAVKTKDGNMQIIGDVANPFYDKRIVETSPNLASLHNKIIEEYNNREDKNNLFVSSFTTHANGIYVGTPEFIKNEVTLSSIPSNNPPILGIIQEEYILTNSNIKNADINKPLTLIEGATIVLIPNGRKKEKDKFYSIAYARNLKLKDYTGDNNLVPIIESITEGFIKSKNALDAFAVARALNNFVYIDIHTDDLKDGSIQIRVGNTRIKLTGDEETKRTIIKRDLMPLIYNSYVQVKKDKLGTNLTIDGKIVPYESIIANYLSINLGNEFGYNKTVGDWFSVNPADTNGKEVVTKPIKSRGVSPASNKVVSVTYNNTNYKVDLRTRKVVGGDGNPITAQVVYAIAWCNFTHGSKTNGVNLIDNIAKLPNGEWFNRNANVFTIDPSELKKRKEERERQQRLEAERQKTLSEEAKKQVEEIEKVMSTSLQGKDDIDIIDEKRKKITTSEDVVIDIINNEKELKLTKDEKYYKDKWGNLYIRVTTAIKDPNDIFDKRNPYFLPSTTIGNVIDNITRDIFGHAFDKVGINDITKKYPNIRKSDLISLIKNLSGLRNEYESRGFTFASEDVTLSGIIKDKNGKELRVAGTVDLLAHDKDGNFYIFDMKTVRNNSESRTIASKIEDNTPKWTDQTNVYRLLLEQSYNVKVKSLKIIPFEVRYPTPEGKGGRTKYTVKDKVLYANNNLYQDVRPLRYNEVPIDILDDFKYDVPTSTEQPQTPLIDNIPLREEDNSNTPSISNLDDVKNTPTISEKPIREENPETVIDDFDNPDKSIVNNTSTPSSNNTSTDSSDNNSLDEDLVDTSDDDIEDWRLSDPNNDSIWNEEVERQWLKEVLPQLDSEERLSVVDGFIKTYSSKNPYAYGRFKNGIIEIANNAARGTLFHEAFHSVYHTLLNEEEKLNILTLAKKKWGKKTNLEYEELLAEDFREYVEDEQYGTPFRRFFKKLWHIIKTLGGRTHTLDSLYYRINRGDFRNRVFNKKYATRFNISNESEYNSSEMKAIKDKAIADGTFMKAPNGNPTNLNERQWLQVRTKAFKDWFGDWEIISKLGTLDKDYRIVPNTDETPDGYSQGYDVYYKGNKIGIVALLGDKNLTIKGINLNHEYRGKGIGKNFYKYLAYQAIKKGGTLYSDNVYNSTISKDAHNVWQSLIKDGLAEEDNNSGGYHIINPNSSKVVDENGEPFVAYTGTKGDFTVFDSKYSKTASKGFFFTADKEVAKRYGDVKEVFLNIKNLKEETTELPSLDLENGKYDGISYIHDGAEAFVVWNPNQIKSATNNTGEFSTTNDDIRYREVNNLSEDSYSTLQQYYNEKTYFDKLNKEDKNLLKELGISKEEWNQLPKEVRENKLHCRR